LDNSSPGDFALHIRSMHDFLLVLGLPDHSSWLLGQEDELSSCCDDGTDFLQVGCSGGAAAAGETASGTGAGVDAGAGAGDLA
jgi:hypothetical protein